MRPKYPHLLYSFLFFSRKFETFLCFFETYSCVVETCSCVSRLIHAFSRLSHAFFETYSCVSGLNSSVFGTYYVRPSSMVNSDDPTTAPVGSKDSRIWKIERRRVRWRHRFREIRDWSSQIWQWRFEDDSGLASFLSPYSSKLKMDTSITTGGARRTFCRWFCRSTCWLAVAPPLKLHQWRFWEKEEEKRWRIQKRKEKKLGGIFVQILFLVLFKQELLKCDSCTSQNFKSAIYPYFLL